MEVNFTDLKRKDVVSTTDGKNLGHICDVTLSFPDGKLVCLVATGGKGACLWRNEVTIPLCAVVKVGEDSLLVDLTKKPPSPPTPCPVCDPCCPCASDSCRRDLGEYD